MLWPLGSMALESNDCLHHIPFSDKGDPNCRDLNKYCPTWSRHKHCAINASYMLKYCKVSCGVCTPAG